jgi:hypothetical protein
MKAWVLTREINEYDQDGEYFVAVFRSKPSILDIVKTLGWNGVKTIGDINPVEKNFIEHILAGGGRRANEHEWYHLRQVEYSN